MADLQPRFDPSSFSTGYQEYIKKMAQQQAMVAQYLQQNGPANFPSRPGIDTNLRQTPSPLALMQMLDPTGFSPRELDRNAAMRGPLYGRGFQIRPDAMTEPNDRQPYGVADKRSLAEDLNSVAIKFGNWRKRQSGEGLSPQDRVTESFIDTRNPNSYW